MQRHTPQMRRRRGYSMIELVTVLAIVGIMMAIVSPRFRVSEAMEVQLAAQQLTQDLDYSRNRALAARARVRVDFDVSGRKYSGFLDNDGDGTVSTTLPERQALRGFGMRELPRAVEFGRGSLPEIPSVNPGGAITFANSRAEFDSRGLTLPMGSSGAVYIRHKTNPQRAAAVTVAPSGYVRTWLWKDGAWK